MIIKLYDYDYSHETPSGQITKIQEELKELEVAGSNLDQVAEESFDVIQALAGYLVTLGIDIEGANEKHLAKLYARHGDQQAGWETKNIFARFQLTDKTIEASKSNVGAFASVLEQEIKDCKRRR